MWSTSIFLEAEKIKPDPYTQYRIGKQYAAGLGTRQDYEAVALWLEKSASAGYKYAQYTLAGLYRDGLGKFTDRGNTLAKYALGKLLLCRETIPRNVDRALELLIECAEAGDQYAQYTLGKAYLLGQDIPQDQTEAVHWLKLSAKQGDQYAQYFLDRFYGSIFSSATTLLYHMGNIFREQRQQSTGGVRIVVDSKLKQKIREKKIAMGHKPDDHEEQEQTM